MIILNCCKNDEKKDNLKKNKKHHMSHMTMMVICCGAPILILLIITLLGYNGILFSLLPFICPIMMVLMMPMMLIGRDKGKSDQTDQTEEKSSNQNLLS